MPVLQWSSVSEITSFAWHRKWKELWRLGLQALATEASFNHNIASSVDIAEHGHMTIGDARSFSHLAKLTFVKQKQNFLYRLFPISVSSHAYGLTIR